MTNSVESRALTHLESIGLGNAAFISMGGPQAHGNSQPRGSEGKWRRFDSNGSATKHLKAVGGLFGYLASPNLAHARWVGLATVSELTNAAASTLCFSAAPRERACTVVIFVHAVHHW